MSIIFFAIPKSTLLKYELTEKGIETYHKTREIRSIDEIMSILSDEELQELMLMLEKIESKAKNY